VGGGDRRVTTRDDRRGGFFGPSSPRTASACITRRHYASHHANELIRTHARWLLCIALIGPRLDIRIYPAARAVRVRARCARSRDARRPRNAMRSTADATRGDFESSGVSPRERRRRRSGMDEMCVKDFVCYRVDVAASASRRRGVGVGASARRHVDGLQRHADVSKRRFGRRSTGVSCVWVYSILTCAPVGVLFRARRG